MAKGGRGNKYYTHVQPYLDVIRDMCRNGATDEMIYKKLCVGKDSFYRYKKEHKELSDILKRNKAFVDAEVENKLLQRAMGYRYEEVTEEPRKNEDGQVEMVVTKRVTKEVTPDTTAQIFWLKNRRPRQWRDKQEIEHSGNIGNKDYKDMTEEELLEIAKERGIKL